jgi:hypothetical protein
LEDWDLEHGWLLENPSGPKGIFKIGCEEGLCTFWAVLDLDRVILECYGQDVGNRTQDGEFFFTEEIDGALYLLA